jgi:hypothetical protein
MYKLFLTAFIAFTGLIAQAQSATETRTVAAFTKIEVQNGIEVIITQADVTSVKVEPQSGQSIANVATESNGNVLKIYLKYLPAQQTGGSNPVKVYITQKELTGIKATAGASVKTVGELKTKGFAMSLASGATFKGLITSEGAFRLDAASGAGFDGIVMTNSFYGNLKGGAVVKIAGVSKNAAINSTTGATCLAANFKCDNVKADARRTSSIVINVKDAIKANTDETASVTYYGSPSSTKLGSDSYAVKRN